MGLPITWLLKTFDLLKLFFYVVLNFKKGLFVG